MVLATIDFDARTVAAPIWCFNALLIFQALIATFYVFQDLKFEYLKLTLVSTIANLDKVLSPIFDVRLPY